jgi:hypothetical protein
LNPSAPPAQNRGVVLNEVKDLLLFFSAERTVRQRCVCQMPGSHKRFALSPFVVIPAERSALPLAVNFPRAFCSRLPGDQGELLRLGRQRRFRMRRQFFRDKPERIPRKRMFRAWSKSYSAARLFTQLDNVELGSVHRERQLNILNHGAGCSGHS